MNLLFLGFILAYNPVFAIFMMRTGNVGAISVRIVTGGICLVLLSISIISKGIVLQRPLERMPATFVLIAVLALNSILMIPISFFNDFDTTAFLIELFPIVELLATYFFARNALLDVGVRERSSLVRRIGIRTLGAYLVACAAVNLAAYFYLSFVKGETFGTLRALVYTVTVNRLMDFIAPALVPILLFFGRPFFRSRWTYSFALVVSLLVTMLTFYRTVHFAVGVTCVVSAALFIRTRQQARTLFVSVGVTAIVALAILRTSVANIDLASTFIDRIKSIVAPDPATDLSGVARMDQLVFVGEIFDRFPFHSGFGVFADGVPVGAMANLFLQTGLILGPIGLVAMLMLWGIVIYSLVRRAQLTSDHLQRAIYGAGAVTVIYFLCVVSLFPFVVHFPIMMAFGCLTALAEMGLDSRTKTVPERSTPSVARHSSLTQKVQF